MKDVEIPAGMQRAMARQAEAERERRAKIIAAEGEFQASQKLADAADVMAKSPMALQLRYLQTLLEIGATNATTIVFPAPIDMLTAFMGKATGGQRNGRLTSVWAANGPLGILRDRCPLQRTLILRACGSAGRLRSPRRDSGPCPWPA